MDDQVKAGGAERLATAALFVIMFAIPFSRAALQIAPIPPIDVIYLGYHAQILQALFILGAWRAGLLRPGAGHSPRLSTWLIVLVITWLAVGVISAATSGFPVISMVSEARWFMWAAFAYAAVCYFRAYPERCEWALDLYVAGFVGFSLLLHFLIYANPDPEYSWVNGIPGFANVRHFGFYAMSALAASYLPLLKADFRWQTRRGLIQLLGVALCWAMVFWSGGRSPMLSILATIAIFAGWRLLPEIGRLAKLSLATVGLAVPWSLLLAVPDPSLGLWRLFGTGGHAAVTLASSGRLEIWRDAAEKVADSPITGVGPGIFPQVMPDQWGHLMHPHNIVVQALLEWGILGGLAFLLALAALAIGILNGLKRGQNRDPLAVAAAFSAMTLLAASFLDGSLFHPFPLMVAAVFAAIYYSRVDYGPASARRPQIADPVAGRSAKAAVGAAILVTLLGVTSSIAQRLPGTPPPDGTRIAILKRLPVSMAGPAGTLSYGRWIDKWTPDIGADAVVSQLDWVMKYAAGHYLLATLEARRACALGQPDNAIKALQVLAASEFYFYHSEKDRIRKTMMELWPACASLPPIPVTFVR